MKKGVPIRDAVRRPIRTSQALMDLTSSTYAQPTGMPIKQPFMSPPDDAGGSHLQAAGPGILRRGRALPEADRAPTP